MNRIINQKIILGIGFFFGLLLLVVLLIILTNEIFADTGSPGNTVQTSQNLAPGNESLPYSYIVEENETIYDIALKLGISHYGLIMANKLKGELPLKPGDVLAIPENIEQYPNTAFSYLPQKLKISASVVYGIAPLAVEFSIEKLPTMDTASYLWDLGNNRFRFEKHAVMLYTRPGTYYACLIVTDKENKIFISNIITITIQSVKAEYQGFPYLTMDRIGDLLNLSGRLYNEQGKPVIFDPSSEIIQDPPLLRQIAPDKFIASNVGFSEITIKKGSFSYRFYLFVSPFPSKHSVEPEYDWYKTQFKTGIYGNCGPASNAMAIKWARGLDFSVEEIREQIGMPFHDGAVSYYNLMDNLAKNNITSSIIEVTSADDLIKVINEGNLAIVSFHCGYIKPSTGDKRLNFVGRYYPDATGHYIVVKGYSLDKEFFVVYDSIPGEWKKNKIRYLDGVSMIGRNRYFRASELLKTIRYQDILVVYRK